MKWNGKQVDILMRKIIGEHKTQIITKSLKVKLFWK